MAGQFPSNSWLWQIRKRDNPQCDICTSQLHATVGHIQCDCNTLADARTKAHIDIWNTVWNILIKQSSKQGWQGYKETPIHKTKWKVAPDTSCDQLQPDGILYREEEDAKQIFILDLTRCRGYDTESFIAAADKEGTQIHTPGLPTRSSKLRSCTDYGTASGPCRQLVTSQNTVSYWHS